MVRGYSRVQILLHWLVGGMILFNLLLPDAMSALWDATEEGGPQPMTNGALVHIVVGVAVLVLVALRLALRFGRGVPPLPESSPRLELAGKLGHWALYAFMILVPATGLLGFFGGLPELAELHGGPFKALLWVLIIGHVVMAFYHHFILKDGLLDRMRKPG